MSDLAFNSAIDIAKQIRERKLSAVECLEYFRKRIQRFNPKLNAIVVFDWDRAHARALQADQALARGESWGPLHGMPMTIKESYDLKNHPTTWGDPALKDMIATEDDLAVQRLESAGAVVFGKTNVPFRLMDFQSYNDIYGTTNNPWDTTRGPGGSSGGAAAALAAGLTGLELGSDIGGSIRNPAHYCGVFGHKSTYGLVGATRMAAPGNLTRKDLGVYGPLARSAEDLALAMQFLAAPGPFDTPAWQTNLPKPTKKLRDYRVVIWSSDARVAVAAEISARCQSIGDTLAKLGAKVSDKARPDVDTQRSTKLYRQLLEAATNPFGELKHSEWLDLDNERAHLRLRWRKFFKNWDIVIAPIAATAAFPHDHSAIQGRTILIDGKTAPYFQQIFWAGLVTVAYLPSTVFPTGINKEGLPIGLQAIGAAYDDLITIDFARLLSQEIGGFTPPPGYQD
ncbi:MAG TPA: amidase family protein [Steroidobacteraceae bacterium]|nr:amidase family protein [Steroidobacteraceae bacterium]